MQNEKNLHETNRYKDVSFPYEMYRVNRHGITPPGRGYLDLHWHEELQFTFVTAGQVHFQVNGDTYKLTAGEAIFINCGLLHVTTYISENGEYVSFNFPDKLLSFFSGSRMEQTYVLPFTSNYSIPVTVFGSSVSWHQKILHHLSDLELLMKKEDTYAWEYAVSIKTVELWYTFIRHAGSQAVKQNSNFIRKQKRIQMLISHIHNNYMTEITLESLAASAHISAGECCRCFKTMLNTTPMEYLKDYRITKSIELLNTTDYSVTEIAGMVGYNYTSHFIRHFKTKTHKTPNEYRSA